MERFNFDHLVERFGEIAAWHYLAEIEKAAGILPRYLIADPELRLVAALHAQDRMAQSTQLAA